MQQKIRGNKYLTKYLLLAFVMIISNAYQPLFAELGDVYYSQVGFSAPLIKQNEEYSNTGSQKMYIKLITEQTDLSVESGYEWGPDISWIIASPSEFTLEPDEKKTVDITINVPYDPLYLGKKYEIVFVANYSVEDDTIRTFLTTKFLLTLDGQAILLTNSGEEEQISKIGMFGNKLIIKPTIVNSGSATLSYRQEGGSSYTTISPSKVTAGNSSALNKAPQFAAGAESQKYTFEIPASEVKSPGIEYYIKSSSGSSKIYYPFSTQDLDDFSGTPYCIDISSITTGTILAKSTSTVAVPDGNSEDGKTRVYAKKNAVSSDLDISITQLEIDSANSAPRMSLSEKPVAIYDFSPSPMKFAKQIDLTMLYLDVDKNGKVDNMSDKDGYEIDVSYLKLFFWDGFEWRVAGVSTVNKENNTVTCKVVHFTKFALFPAPSLSPEDYRPKKKIITPNDDLINDDADFNALNEEIKIYDITGERIKTVAKGVGTWDGKDDDGKVVESGTYIYQYKVDGKLISGVIVVAK